MKLRQMEIVIYCDHLKVDIQETCKKYTTIKQWAYILHDKDDTGAHYHIYLNFHPHSCDTALVAKWFDLGYVAEDGEVRTGEQFIEKVKGRKTDMLLYLTHGNDSQKNKHQYSTDEVIANFDFVTEIEESKIIGDFEHYSYAQMLQYANGLSIVEKTKVLSQLKKLWELECLVASMDANREVDVVFITGKSGSGKTTYAKKLLESLGYDYCMSSNSNDLFQDYLGQRAFIFDDLRDWMLPFQDLIKVLDPYTKSSISSRFHNKIFTGKMIVITSSVPLTLWYKHKNQKTGEFFDLNEDFYQLYRRISCYVRVSDDYVFVYDEGVDENGKPIGLPMMYENDIPMKKRVLKSKFDFHGAFGKICTPVDIESELLKNKRKNS